MTVAVLVSMCDCSSSEGCALVSMCDCSSSGKHV